MTSRTCNGELAVASNRGFDACPHCEVTRVMPTLRLVPLVSTPQINLSSAVSACVASSYGAVRPRLCDPDEATVVERRVGGAQ